MENRLRILPPSAAGPRPISLELRISRQSINAIETGKYDPSLPLAFKLARLFETTIENLFTDSLIPATLERARTDLITERQHWIKER